MSDWSEILKEAKSKALDDMGKEIDSLTTELKQVRLEVRVSDDISKKLLIENSKIRTHAPVINAEALAEKIDRKYDRWALNNWEEYPGEDKAEKFITQLITDSRDLNITWKDGKSRWGDFLLEVGEISGNYEMEDREWWASIELNDADVKYIDGLFNQESAIKACEQHLRSIVCGVKS